MCNAVCSMIEHTVPFAHELFGMPVLSSGTLASLAMLTLLEVGLGFDNVAFMAMEVNKLPAISRPRATSTGMALAAVMRILLLALSGFILTLLTADLFSVFGEGFSGKDLLLCGGGLYLLWHGGKELYEAVEKPHTAQAHGASGGAAGFATVMRNIAVINVVFSLDSVLTAVGTAKNFWVMALAIVISIFVMAKCARVVGDFLERHVSLKILTISFLFLIGSNLIAEAFHQEMNKAFVYWPALFALGLMLLTIRAEANKARTAP
ncbi:MAG: TerC family protein [Proteobacteria bacterium]|nr:TerC family protein [Pseudomonadota bacterium]